MSFQLQDSQKVALGVQELDGAGNPVANPSDTFTFDVDNPSLLALTDNGDGTAEIAAVGPLGSANVNVTSSGGLTGQLAVDIVNSAAATIVVNAGTPETK